MTMTHLEFSSRGGRARAKKLTKEQRISIARKAGQASAKRMKELKEQKGEAK